MSILNCIPELWNVAMMDTFEKAQVFGKVARCEIDAPITKKGQSVHISGIGDITIGSYTGADIVMQELADTGIVLKIDHADYFNFWVDDIDALQANANLMSLATKKAAYRMKDTADIAINAAMLAGAGLTTVAVNTTAVLIISAIAEMDLVLKDKEIPQEQRWIIIPHWAGTKLLLAGVYHAMDLKGNINGFIGNQLGIDMYESGNVTTTVVAAGQYGTVSNPIAGSYDAVAYAEQIVETEAFKPEKRFGDALKGLHVYGIKVVKPNELVYGAWTRTVDTLI